ncbi:MAG: PAS domain S-box protein [Thermoplasmatales archaeon]|nr:MAG: PAS domain S-box protein [Thermoplasmatales archaeon]
MVNNSYEHFFDEKAQVNLDTPDERYKTLFEQVNAATFLTTFEGQILEANHKSCDLFGYRWNELLRLSIRDVLPKETDWSQFQDEIAARGCLNIETESVRKDGSYVPVEISISLFKMDGKPVMFVLLWDVTERRDAEKRLKESEKKYRGLFEYATDGIFVLDARGDILDVNTKLCEMIDLTKDEIIGRNLFSMDFLTAKSLPIVVSQFEQLLSEKTANNYTTQILNKQGKLLDVEVSSFFLIKKDKEVDNFILIVRDVTPRNETEKKRIREHELLKTLMDNVPDSVYFKDAENRFILVNKAKAEHSNVSPEEMINKTDFDFLPEDQARKIFDDDNNIMQSGQPIINKLEKLTHSNGSERWLSVTKVPRYSVEGDIIGTMGISRDVTSQKNVEEGFIKSEGRYKAIFENSSFAIIFTDEHRRIISWNKLVENLLNMDHDDLNMKPVEALYHPEEWEKIQSECVQDGEIKRCIETKIYRNDRNTIDVDLSINVLKDKEGKILGYTHIIYDVTKRKNTDKELERNQEFLTMLMDNFPDSIYFKDDQNRFILVNKAKAERSNTSPEEMTNKTDFDYLPHDMAQKAFEDDNKILKTGEPIIDKIERITGSDGLERWFSVTKVPRYGKGGKITGTMGISRDITKWKKVNMKEKNK